MLLSQLSAPPEQPNLVGTGVALCVDCGGFVVLLKIVHQSPQVHVQKKVSLKPYFLSYNAFIGILHLTL